VPVQCALLIFHGDKTFFAAFGDDVFRLIRQTFFPARYLFGF
jgi:hypothetical protein